MTEKNHRPLRPSPPVPAPPEVLDLRSISLEPPSGTFEAFFKSFETLEAAPEPNAAVLIETLSRRFNRPPQDIAVGHSAQALIRLAAQAVRPARMLAVLPAPRALLETMTADGRVFEECRLSQTDDFFLDSQTLSGRLRPGDLAVLSRFSYPITGLADRAALADLADAHPKTTFLVEDTWAGLTGPDQSLADLSRPNLLVWRSLGDAHGLPGLAVSALSGPADLMGRIRRDQGSVVLSGPSLELARFLTGQPQTRDDEARRALAAGKAGLTEQLRSLPEIRLYAAWPAFLLLESKRTDLAALLRDRHRLLLADGSALAGLGPEHLFIPLLNGERRDRLTEALRAVFDPPRPKLRRRTTPALMIQGTCSNAGKSILAAAFCRLFLQDGFSVAPFKAQNMALNSYVTADGLEIGRAQAFQAEACRLDPDVRMNPLLLKPNTDTGSQVVLKGRPVGNLDSRNFRRSRSLYWESVKECYDSLAAEYDLIVLEGAGSPAEVNLKSGDIVNMNMAAHARARVLLAGDIDRGGTYAAFAGTFATLTPAERDLLAGFLVNKFRGDAALLAPAHEYIRHLTGKPVWAVLDYLRDLRLPEEDSASQSDLYNAPRKGRALDGVLLTLPHIANFTDFDPLLLEPDLRLRKVRETRELGRPDLIILPGTKNTGGDLVWMRERGLDRAVTEAHRAGAWLIGICGGMQMLGVTVKDPLGLESPAPELPGLGLLPLDTVLDAEKILKQNQAARQRDGSRLTGYEIHHGRTVFEGRGLDLHISDEGVILGAETERIFATYLHGVFDDDQFRRRFLNEIRAERGWPPLAGVTARYETEESLNRLADHLRSRINLQDVYRLLRL